MLVDLGIAAEIEEKHVQENATKQPKKRFVGRRAAAEAAKSGSGPTSIEDTGAIQGTGIRFLSGKIIGTNVQLQLLSQGGRLGCSTKSPLKFSTMKL